MKQPALRLLPHAAQPKQVTWGDCPVLICLAPNSFANTPCMLAAPTPGPPCILCCCAGHVWRLPRLHLPSQPAAGVCHWQCSGGSRLQHLSGERRLPCTKWHQTAMSTVPVGPQARLWVLLLAPQALHSSLRLPPLSRCCASAYASRSVLCASLYHCSQARLLNLEPGYFRVGDNGPCGNAQGGKYDVMAAGECGRASGGVHLAGEGDLRML